MSLKKTFLSFPLNNFPIISNKFVFRFVTLCITPIYIHTYIYIFLFHFTERYQPLYSASTYLFETSSNFVSSVMINPPRLDEKLFRARSIYQGRGSSVNRVLQFLRPHEFSRIVVETTILSPSSPPPPTLPTTRIKYSTASPPPPRNGTMFLFT